ncbi:DUF2895 family protein [Vibrio sp. PNB22_3_1]
MSKENKTAPTVKKQAVKSAPKSIQTAESGSKYIKAGLPKSSVSLVQELQSHIQTLRLLILLLVSILAYSVYSHVNSFNDITVHIPPDVSAGVSMEVGEIPPASVFVYTTHLWIEFNSWLSDGSVDAYANLEKYRDYFGPSFFKLMREELDFKFTRSGLNRQRRLSLLPGSSAEALSRVVPITDYSWVVYLDVVDEEFYLGERVKNSKIRYSLLVEQVDTSIEKNPLGVRIVGFKDEPKLLKEF